MAFECVVIMHAPTALTGCSTSASAHPSCCDYDNGLRNAAYGDLQLLSRAHLQDPADISEARAGPVSGDDGDLLHGISSEKDMLCVASGCVIAKQADGQFAVLTQRCRRCRHHMIVDALKRSAQSRSADGLSCPLCHGKLQNGHGGG
jgi:hypothetical protein